MTTALLLAASVAALGSAADCVTTAVALKRGLREGNPWAAAPPALPPNCGTAYCGCASGVGSWPPKIDVSQRLGRVEQLVSWEITNAFLGSIRRPDLWDNAYVSSVVTRVGQQIGGWSQ